MSLPHAKSPERRVLEVLSVLYQPVSHSTLEAAWLRDRQKTRGLSETLHDLKRSGLVVETKQHLACAPSCREPVMLAMARNGPSFQGRARTILGPLRRDWRYGGFDPTSVRVDIYARDRGQFRSARSIPAGCALLLDIAAGHTDPTWLDHFPEPADFASEVLRHGNAHLAPNLDATVAWVGSQKRPPTSLRFLIAQHRLLRGDRQGIAVSAREFPDIGGWVRFLEGDYTGALRLWDQGDIRSGRPLSDWPAFLYWTMLVRAGRERELRSLPTYHYPSLGWALWLSRQVAAPVPAADGLDAWLGGKPALNLLPAALALYWLGLDAELERRRPEMELLRSAAARAGYGWVEAEFGALLEGRQTSLSSALPRIERWRRSLDFLRSLGGAEALVAPRERLIWVLALTGSLQPKLQKPCRGGGWTSGRQMDWYQLWSQQPAYLTPLDREILAVLQSPVPRPAEALRAVARHPLVFLEGNLEHPIELVETRPELTATRKDGQISLKLATELPAGTAVVLEQESSTRCRFVVLDEALRQLGLAVGAGLAIPSSEEESIRDVLGGLCQRVDVRSDLQLGLETIEADPTLHLHLRPEGEGLIADLKIKPFGPAGTNISPGSLPPNVAAQVNGSPVQARRDLAEEQRRVAVLRQTCPGIPEEMMTWSLPRPLECLELLEGLSLCEEGLVTCHWPKGQPLKVRRRADLSQLKLRVGSQQDWFEIDGELAVDESLVLDLRRLLDGAQQGRFIPIGNGEFLALTESFRERLRQFADLDSGRGRGVKLGGLGAAVALEDLITEGDRRWTFHLERMRAARELEPAIPSGFGARLRPYQEDGFRWLARLAHWGAGACLADDMGLGKTIQSLALLLHRASLGPALVVAPTSVLGNWIEEAARFAPELRVHSLGEADRRAVLGDLRPGDLVVCSYAILVRESAALSAKEWATVVLDESQSIKNPTTHRFQAAVGLRAGFRLATTGTPLENHLGELWALFRFLNPGLLGSLKRFTERFANPIEKYRDPSARERLRALIRPFVLRRTKNEVLCELPGKTDITVRVELGVEERAFYESVRRRAVEQLENAPEKPGEQAVRVLAELMRLRRACCHPQLVLPDAATPASKLKVFLRLVDELLAGGHRVLVFSQFVDFLSIVRTALEERGIAHTYLDGSTPARRRRQLVEGFQSGEAPVFLISLKAGGVGLNLTAADYVVHLDPWWNPAVEDQASDRAHRLGQTRPVTVYRLVCAHTVEEKIVELHRSKRELAEGLLAGTDGGARLSTEELLDLLRHGEVPAAPAPLPAARPDAPSLDDPGIAGRQQGGQQDDSALVRDLLHSQGRVTSGQVMDRCRVARPRAKAILERMTERGELRRIGDRGRWVCYEPAG